MSEAPKTISVEYYSTTASPLAMWCRGHHISSGTAFFWGVGKDVYLVTNGHNVTGIHPETGKHLDKINAAQPDAIEFDCFRGEGINDRVRVKVDLYDKEGMPLWFEHPRYGPKVDVVCLKLSLDDRYAVSAINHAPSAMFKTAIADDVFILGFPRNIGPERFPVWKRASIATELEISIDGLPKFLVDTASSQGMSGSPVIRRESSTIKHPDGSISFARQPVFAFIGIYSGRVNMDEGITAQLGIVWHASVIGDIINGAMSREEIKPGL